MSKNCLLCGKPLSRIRVGGGEDFCTREHRNQYRLRQGMDRLTEANKVANVMRRRENPRPLVNLPVSNQPAPRSPEITVRFQANLRKAVPPASLPKLDTQPPDGSDLRQTVLQPRSRAENPRSYSLMQWRVDRLRFPRTIPALRQPPGARVPLFRAGEAVPSIPRAQRGRALKVSLSAAFPRPKLRAQQLPPSAPRLYGRLSWNDAPQAPVSRDIPAKRRVLRPQPKIFGPLSDISGPAFRSGIENPGTLGRRAAMQMVLQAASIDPQPMQFLVPTAVRNRIPNFRPFEIRRSPEARNTALIVLQPAALAADPRVTSVAFVPQDLYAITFVQEQESK